MTISSKPILVWLAYNYSKDTIYVQCLQSSYFCIVNKKYKIFATLASGRYAVSMLGQQTSVCPNIESTLALMGNKKDRYPYYTTLFLLLLLFNSIHK